MALLADEIALRVTVMPPAVTGTQTPITVFQGAPGYLMRLAAISFRFDFGRHDNVYRGFVIQYRDKGGAIMFEVAPVEGSTGTVKMVAEHSFESCGIRIPLYQDQPLTAVTPYVVIDNSALPDLWMPEQSQIGFDEQTTRFSDDSISNCVMTVEYR